MNSTGFADFFRTSRSTISLLIVLLVLGAATLMVVLPYITTFLLALVFVLLFEPWYIRLKTWTKKPYLASGLTTLAIALLIILPTIAVIATAVYQASLVVAEVQKAFLQSENTLFQVVRNYTNTIPENLEIIRIFIIENEATIVDLAFSTLKNTTTIVGNSVIPFIGGGLQQLLKVVIFFATLVYLFPSKNSFFRTLSQLNPLGEDKHHAFMKRFVAVTKATMRSLLIIALVQGILGWIIYTAVGLPVSTLLGVMQAAVSFVPLGSGVLYIPISLGLLITGSWIQGIIVMLWGIFVISTVDNFIRPHLLKEGEAALPELVTMFSALGGVALFGFWGFLFGPIIAALFLTALDMYKAELH